MQPPLTRIRFARVKAKDVADNAFQLPLQRDSLRIRGTSDGRRGQRSASLSATSRRGRSCHADRHAILVFDGVGYRGAGALTVPENITLLRLPPYAPELNPIENVG